MNHVQCGLSLGVSIGFGQIRRALANGDLENRLAYQPPGRPRQSIISPFVLVPLFQNAA